MSCSKKFAGKVILITGSSSGIGREIAINFSSLGANVVITGRDREGIKSVAEICRKNCGTKALEVTADMQKDEDIGRIISETIKTFGKIDVLVNNAGICRVAAATDPNFMDSFEEVMNTNVRSVLKITRLAIPYLEVTKGNIVNISSIAGMKPGEFLMSYCISKTSLDMITKCLAIELGPKGIRVNSINPACVRTSIFPKMGIPTETVAENVAKAYPLGRIGEPLDCAQAVAYLASSDASFISGNLLTVDGGSLYTARSQDITGN